jgi:hypothetical protein
VLLTPRSGWLIKGVQKGKAKANSNIDFYDQEAISSTVGDFFKW